MRRLNRRQFLGLAGVATAGLALTNCVAPLTVSTQTGKLLKSERPLPQPFQVPLPVPPVKKPSRSDDTTDYYEVTQRESNVEILPGVKTAIFGYDGIFPGPTFEARSGRKLVVRHVNQLPVPAVVHLHGGNTPAESDGYTTDLILPQSGWDNHNQMMMGDIRDGSRDYTYPMTQRASMLWYHDHRMDFTGPQVWRGLAGMHLIRDDEESKLPLPQGPHEIPLMIVDRSFNADGQLHYPSRDPSLRGEPGATGDYVNGVLGDVILVNGAPWPVAEVEAVPYRLRFLNASNARRYRLTLDPAPSGGKPFTYIGTDGGLLEKPVPTDTVDLAPAERADVIVDFSRFAPGTEITVRNAWGSGSTAQVMRFRVTRTAKDDSTIPAKLSAIERLDPKQATVHRTWRLSRGDAGEHHGWVINGKAFDPTRIMARSKLNEIEIWKVSSDQHHPLHIHLDPFQIVSRGDKGVPDHESGWKDTIDLLPFETVELAIRFTNYRGRYLFHCHNLEHEDMAMMATFETV